ncbi:MAG: zinc ribbon domain-containing protein, partial [Myxococcales bacterium]|nr:zinc ribbon domain-containing protein [Myxococcales bacterium]
DDDDEVALTIEDDDDLEEEEVELEDDFDEDSYAGDDPAERITATPAGDDEVAEDDESLDELEEEAESLDEDLDEEDLDELEEEEPEDGEEAAPLELLSVVAKPEPPRRGSSHPPRRRASLADLEPPFGSLATVADPTLVAELPPIDDDNPYAAALTSAREMTTDALHAPASAVVGLGKEEGEEPPQEAAALRRLCIVCGHRLLAEEQFCGMCGTSTAVEDDLPVCEACGSNIYPDTSFCVECGVQHGIEWY